MKNQEGGFDCLSDPVAVLTLDKGPDMLLTDDMYFPSWVRTGDTIEISSPDKRFIELHTPGKDMVVADPRNTPIGLFALLPGYDDRGMVR